MMKKKLIFFIVYLDKNLLHLERRLITVLNLAVVNIVASIINSGTIHFV